MDFNDFMVLPKSQAKSVKLNGRNFKEMQKKTRSLDQETVEMAAVLQRLKERMSKEKQERGQSAKFRWNSEQHGASNSSALKHDKRSKENILQLLSEGKVKLQVLKHEPLTAPPQPVPPTSTTGRKARKTKLIGAHCGQSEVKSTGPTELQTHVSTQDVSCFQMNPCSVPRHNSKSGSNHTEFIESKRQKDQKPNNGLMKLHFIHSQAMALNQQEEENIEIIKEELKKPDERAVGPSLLVGAFNEEKSKRSFQEALRQWRGERSGGVSEPTIQDAAWTPVPPVSAVATQAELTPDRGAECRGFPFRVEFTENSLTYMEKLLLKKNRRTPLEMFNKKLDLWTSVPPTTNTVVETARSLTAEEEDFHRYCASLFAAPAKTESQTAPPVLDTEVSEETYQSRGRTKPQTAPPLLNIEVLGEEVEFINGDFAAEQRTNDNKKVFTVQMVPDKRVAVPRKALTCGGSVRTRLPPSHPKPLRDPAAPAQSKPAQNHHLSRPQSLQAEHTKKFSSSKSKPPAGSASETPRTSKPSIQTPPSTLQKPGCNPTAYKSKPDQRSALLSFPHTQAEIFKGSHAPVSFPPGITPFVSAQSPIPEDHPFLRSKFTVPPECADLTFLSEFYKSSQFQKGSQCAQLPEQLQFSQSLSETILSAECSQSPSSNLGSITQLQQSLCGPRSPLLVNKPQLRMSPMSYHPPSNSLRASPPVKTLFNESLPDAYSRQRSHPTNEYVSSQNLEEEDSDVSIDSLDEEDLHEVLTREGSRDEIQEPLMGESPWDREFSVNNQSAASGTEELYDLDVRLSVSLSVNSDSDPSEDTACYTERTSQSSCVSVPTGSTLSGKSTLAVSPRYRSTSTLRSETPVLSRAAREILEICGLDQVGCEDPDLDDETAMRALHNLREELRAMANDKQHFGIFTRTSGSQDHHGHGHVSRGIISMKQKEAEEAAERDLQSVLLLP